MLKSVNKSDKQGYAAQPVQYPDSILWKYEVALCAIISIEPFRTVTYSIEKERLLDDAETEKLFSDVRCLLINFRPSDERYFAANLIKTVSVQTLFSIAWNYPFHEDDLDYVFRQTIHMHYSRIFNNTKVDFSNMFCTESFWKRVVRMIVTCLDTLQSQCLSHYVDLEIQVTPVLHRMYDRKYPIDAIRARQEYAKLQRIRDETVRQIQNDGLVSPDICELVAGDINLLPLISLRNKLEEKMNRFPDEILKCRGKRAFISSNFRSIGTVTHRITTYQTNIQGLLSVLRKCLLPRNKEMLVSYDIVSSQLFILACLAGEYSLIQQYQDGSDIYKCIASKMTGQQESEITVEERSVYKKIILQMIYGAGIQTLCSEMQSAGYQMSFAGIKAMKKRFFEAYPAIRDYCCSVRNADYVLLPAGRKWFVKEIEPYRKCAYIMQFVESLILRKTLILLKDYAKREWLDLYMTIHDSIWLEVNIRFYKLVQKLIQECFDKALYSILKIRKIRIKEKIIMTLQSAIKAAERNKKACVSQPDYSTIRMEVSYPALITEAKLDSDQKSIVIKFAIWRTSMGTERESRFSLRGYAENYFQEFCETLEVDNYKDLHGVPLWVHFEMNDGYQNAKADSRMTMKELQSAISAQAKGSKKNSPSQVNAENLEQEDFDEDFDPEILQYHIDTVKQRKKRSSTAIKSLKRRRAVQRKQEDFEEESEPEDSDDFEEESSGSDDFDTEED